MSTEEKRNPNEAREVSILKRNLRLLKRVVLGKQKPPMFLKLLSFFFLGWDLLMIVFFSFIPIVGSIFGDVFKGTSLSAQDFYVYVLLHIISLVGVIMMYRRYLWGFYMFAAANLSMVIWFVINGDAMNSKDSSAISWWSVLAFAMVSILLFLLNWNKFRANIKKKEQRANQDNSSTQQQ